MTHISFTSGELMDIMHVLSIKCQKETNPHLAAYYGKMYQQFEMILEEVNKMQPENKVANLILAA